MSEAEPGAERPEDTGAWIVPGVDPWQRAPRDPQLPGGSEQHPEPTWPGLPAAGYQGGYYGGYPGGYQGGYPGGWGGPGGAGGGGGRRRAARLRQAATVIAVALVAAGAGAGIAYAVAGPTSPSNTAAPGSSTPTPSQAPPAQGNPGTQSPNGFGQQPTPGPGQGNTPPGSGAPGNVGAIAAKVDPGLVDVNVQFGYQGVGGAGTGIVLTSTGEVLTNNHVIDGATSVSVTDIGNGQTYGATVVGYDSTHDMAILQLHNASGLRTAAISPSAPKVAEPVVAIGNAGGVGGTPTAAGGSVTALDQSITASDSLDGTDEQLTGLIETNADVQSGDSGGSLVNANGQVIGMDTAASSGFSFQSQSSGTQGFAIPISQAVSTARQIEAGDGTSVIHVGATAFLGVSVSTSGSSGGGSGNFPGQGNSAPGAMISGVVNGGAAQAAGLQDGDVITSLAGQTVGSSSALSKILVSHHPGDRVELGWTDTAGQSHTATVNLASGPPA